MSEIKINYVLVFDLDLAKREEYIAKKLSSQLDLSQAEILQRLLSRKKLGDIQIGQNFELQHIDSPQVDESISLFRFVNDNQDEYNSLVISLDSQNVGDEIQALLTDLLVDETYQKLELVSDEFELKELLWRKRSV